MRESPFLAGALARRLTHDLSGPLAALVTLSELSPEADPLMGQAIIELRTRLSLARTLFGGEPDCAFDRSEAQNLLAEHLQARGHSLSVALPVQDRSARGMLLLCLAAADRLMAAGAISATPDKVQAEGRHRPVDGALADALATGTTADPQLAAAATAAVLLGPLQAISLPSGLVFSAAHP